MFSKTPRTVSIILIILFLVITAATVYSISLETRTALKVSVQEKLMSAAGIEASEIDGDSFALLHTGDENTAVFIQIRDQIHRVKEASPEIRYIYTMRKNKDTVEFVVDGDYGYSNDAVHIGESYPQAQPELLAGFFAPSADTEFTTDKWGTVLSGYAPIRDSNGTVVGIVGVDMDSSVVMAKLDRINLILYLVSFIAMIFVVMGILIVERRRALDERKLEESEKRYRLLFERAHDCILVLEAEGEEQGKIIAANTASAEMHGYSVEEMLTKNIADLDSPESRTAVPGRFLRLLNGEWLKGEVTHVRKDGTIFPLEINAGLLDMGTKKYVLAIDRDITERKKAEDALQQVTKKLMLLNSVTFNDIQNAVFSLNGYLELEKTGSDNEAVKKYREREEESVQKISDSLTFAKSYQDLGVKPPQWQNVNQSFILGISHLDFSSIHRNVGVDNLEIYADSLLERVFYTFADNVLRHAPSATQVTIGYQLSGDSIVLFFEDNGNGIPDAIKEKIFERGFGTQKGMELFLVREILSITGITIRESGEPGKGARFEMIVPKGGYRFMGTSGK
jgi:PAS domain S-box-containing protein